MGVLRKTELPVTSGLVSPSEHTAVTWGSLWKEGLWHYMLSISVKDTAHHLDHQDYKLYLEEQMNSYSFK